MPKFSAKVMCRNRSGTLSSTLESNKLTTMISPFGRHRWARLPFSLKISSEIFQNRLNEALEGLTGVMCVADDILVTGCGDTKVVAERDHDENGKLGRATTEMSSETR